MATIRKNGKNWQAIIRKKRRQLSKSFEKKSDAVKWSAKVEYEIEQGVFNNSDRLNSLKVSELIWLYYEKTKHQTKWSERLEYEILNYFFFSSNENVQDRRFKIGILVSKYLSKKFVNGKIYFKYLASGLSKCQNLIFST